MDAKPHPDFPPLDEKNEAKVALKLTLLVLVTLTVVKPLGGIPILGTILFTIAAVMQLYLPLWRIDRLGLEMDFIGLTFKNWREDLKTFGLLALITFPPFVVAHHFYITQGQTWAIQLGFEWLAPYIPQRVFGPEWPTTLSAWGLLSWTVFELTATHFLGVALPEETFYRGYLQPRLEAVIPPKFQFAGAFIGRAALIAAALFALGHFLGEWNPLRLGPFFPALLFAWQRNRSGTVMGAIAYHATSNLLAAALFALYIKG